MALQVLTDSIEIVDGDFVTKVEFIWKKAIESIKCLAITVYDIMGGSHYPKP